MGSTCVVGLQWGDEAKGKIVDLLCDQHDVVVRYQGGANAGHTVVVEGMTYKLSLVPTGILRQGVHAVIGNGVVIHPPALLQEIDRLTGQGIDIGDRLHISDRAHVILPYHVEEERLTEESASTADHLGTTRRGIGPCYRDKVGRVHGVRMGDLYHPGPFTDRLQRIIDYKNRLLPGDAAGFSPVRRGGGRRRNTWITPNGCGLSCATRRSGCTRPSSRADGCFSRGRRGRCWMSTMAAIRM